MSICDFGMESKVSEGSITVDVSKKHPLIQLALILPWQLLYEAILPDLKNTKGGLWNRGRRLKVRIHLGAYILQQLFSLKDRQIEYGVRDNAAYQIFCGRTIVKDWHAPDHTSIEKFRSRLKPETQRQLSNIIVSHAVKLGFADPKSLDIDSTIQEANMTYPTDAKMLRKLGMIAAKVSDALKKFFPDLKNLPKVDLKDIALKARNCFFQKRYMSNEEKSNHLQQLWDVVSQPVRETIEACTSLCSDQTDSLKWNIKRAISQLVLCGEAYLSESKIFIDTGKATESKRLSFHLTEVECFSKGKAHKKHEFGRAFQLGRLGGNFMYVAANTTVRMDDKTSVVPVVTEYKKLFGEKILDSLATDKGYYSKKNIKHMQSMGIAEIGIQQPSTVKQKVSLLSREDEEKLYNRRSGIEPLIGHIKQGGQLGRSRMKTDSTIEASGYASVLGFNLRQTIRAQLKKTA